MPSLCQDKTSCLQSCCAVPRVGWQQLRQQATLSKGKTGQWGGGRMFGTRIHCLLLAKLFHSLTAAPTVTLCFKTRSKKWLRAHLCCQITSLRCLLLVFTIWLSVRDAVSQLVPSKRRLSRAAVTDTMRILITVLAHSSAEPWNISGIISAVLDRRCRSAIADEAISFQREPVLSNAPKSVGQRDKKLLKVRLIGVQQRWFALTVWHCCAY